jgi:tRNA-intron endonuclease, archaea type
VSGVVAPDATAAVADPGEGSAVHARGFFGTVEGTRLTLDRYETVYLGETRRLELVDDRDRPVGWERLFRSAVRSDPDFGLRYVVYRDLRQRGYVVRASPPPVAFSVLPRGGILHKTPSKYWVQVESERSPFDLARTVELADRAQSVKKSLLIALVDEESDLTYYRVRRPSPAGSHPKTPLPRPCLGWLVGDRVVVFEPEAVEALGREQSYGSRIGDRLEVSLLEADYLRSTGQIEIRDARSARKVPEARFLARARRVEEGFDERRTAYRDLRERGLVVKTGFKYGADFRAYPRNPDRVHARFLIRAARSDREAPWPEIAGGVRVAQGVRKEFLIASVGPSPPVRFIALERIRP